MKKTFLMSHPKIKLPRLIESYKHEVKKYLKRERNKPLTDGADYWDFDCRYGVNELSAEPIHLATINKHIDEAETQKLESFYLEIMAKPATKSKP